MAHKRNEGKGEESKTGYTGKYFRYDQFLAESSKEENGNKKEKNNKKKNNKKGALR